MANIKVSLPGAKDAKKDELVAGYSTNILIDDVPVRDVRDFSLHFPLDGPVTAELEILVRTGFEFEAGGLVKITAVCLDPDLELIEERLDSRTTKYYVRRKEQEEAHRVL